MDNNNFKICSDYKRINLDFSEIQREKNNPLDKNGYPIYPYILPSSQGSSFTYKISDDWFFKRKLQDGNAPALILSQHHFNKSYNELQGSFDDLAEVICYILAKNIIDKKTNEPIVKVAEYKLATYTDKDDYLLRGCVSKNVCTNPDDKFISMSEILVPCGITGNSINVYMQALEKYCKIKNYIFDYNKVRRNLIKNSYFCWLVANSDNHKNNITFIISKNQEGKIELKVSPLIDNGSAYELSSPYLVTSTQKSRFQELLNNDEFSREDEFGNRFYDFLYYPYMHTAFYLDNDNLILNDTKISDKSFAYEYCIASEMFSDKDLYNDIYEINKQIDIQKMFDEIDMQYGSAIKGAPPLIEWPKYLKEYIIATNEIKNKTLAYVLADYYLYVAFNACIETIDRQKPSNVYNYFKDAMLSLPLQENKEAYDKIFLDIAKSLKIEIDEKKLNELQFKKIDELNKSENQPN